MEYLNFHAPERKSVHLNVMLWIHLLGFTNSVEKLGPPLEDQQSLGA